MSASQKMGMRLNDAHSPLRPITPEQQQGKNSFGSGMWQRLHHFFGRDDHLNSPINCPESGAWSDQPEPTAPRDPLPRSVGVGLPRQTTFRRQNSEKRNRLCPVEPRPAERRAVSHSRQTSLNPGRPRTRSSPPPLNHGRTSAPAVTGVSRVDNPSQPIARTAAPDVPDTKPDEEGQAAEPLVPPSEGVLADHVLGDDGIHRPPRPPSTTSSNDFEDERIALVDEKAQINAELDSRWILNLSMHFRDKSDREKFFVTYAESPNKWRRVTVSCDYRNAEPDSLEMDLKELQFQRDKSLQIYESIRDSLRDIQFYDTVTNLKLETSEGRLHVHVTEDVNEIIPYPPRATVAHILDDEQYRPKEVLESELTFDSHLSGFVYKVYYQGKMYIKKEIPGPDTVDEFLYEINALHALYDSEHVILLEGIVLDDSRQTVKGLLISFAERGAIVDLLYDHRGSIPWEDRLRWARDAVYGLSDIHEEGYVQGDFTLSNIVVDAKGGAKIIDINRRGCPVGWEPPEIARKIASHQRISMYIAEKTDLYQLGMTLWALAADDDEPERHDPPLSIHALPDEIPGWYKQIVAICLEDRPRNRLSAKELRQMFPSKDTELLARLVDPKPLTGPRKEKVYIDPAQAVELADIGKLSQPYEQEQMSYSPQSSRDDYTFTYPRSSNYERESDISAFERPRGRRPPTNFEHLSSHERQHWSPERSYSPSFNDEDAQIVAISPGMEPEYDQIDFDGQPFLIARNTFSDEELQILEHRSHQPSENAAQPSESVGDESDETFQHHAKDEASQSRPLLAQRTSATSSSTPRNSDALLPCLSPGPSNSEEDHLHSTALGHSDNHLTLNPDTRGEPEALETTDWHRPAPPQLPPRLPYADSGYDEPLNYRELEDLDLQHPAPAVEVSQHNSRSERQPLASFDHQLDLMPIIVPGANHADTSERLFTPPPLLRAATSIRIGGDTASSLPEENQTGNAD